MENKHGIYHSSERLNSLLVRMKEFEACDTVASIHQVLRTFTVLTSALLAIDSEYAKSLILKNH